ncbi:MAG: ATP-binding protein [Burkholderiaceae bacterium]|nr:ATP-binding protein [Burkholderiaceae bacterium]
MDDQSLVLAAEDCPKDEFQRLHVFLSHEERIIEALCAHGPVLIRGGRGSGKSALMIEANRRLNEPSSPAVGIYLSLRNVPLLRSSGTEYERLLCELLSREISRTFTSLGYSSSIIPSLNDVSTLQFKLSDLAEAAGKRLVIMFDDVAHIGRETSLEEFFGIFRTISNSLISCKASIYPGVTRFGIRFDVYNDATVIDLARDERGAGYADFFEKVLRARFPKLYSQLEASRSVSAGETAAFLGRTVVGNMRGFVIACIKLQEKESIGLPTIESTLKELASDYYWPLLEELEPKLGVYQPLVSISRTLAEIIFKHAASQNRATTVIVHRDIVQRLAKVFEILEYVGFISKREGSRAMRSGGRGPRFALNLANLLESTQQSRLTRELFKEWQDPNPEQPSDIHTSSGIITLEQPSPLMDGELQVFDLDISKLAKSSVYPYGLTDNRIQELKAAGFSSIGQLADASDEDLRQVNTIGDKWLERIRSVVGQAVWM